MKVAVIVQARIGSTRLPAKVLLPLPTGRCILEECLYRCSQIEGINVVVAALPDTPENDILTDYCGSAIVVRGSEHDVLARYLKAADEVGADVLIRITSDCPLIDPEVCSDVLRLFKESDVSYASNVEPAPRTWPSGYDCEVFSLSALKQADACAEPSQREHVTLYLRRNDEVKKANFEAPATERTRCTVDTIDDYLSVYGLCEKGQ